MLFKNTLIHRPPYRKFRLTHNKLFVFNLCMRSITPLEVLETALKNAFERFYFLRKMADCSQAFFIQQNAIYKFF
ncbi:hypothetical protein ACQJ9K_04295 [Helicobacter pylori]